MTFLDSSVIIDLLEGVDETVGFIRSRDDQLLTSSICVYEVLDGVLGSGSTDMLPNASDSVVFGRSNSPTTSRWKRLGSKTNC